MKHAVNQTKSVINPKVKKAAQTETIGRLKTNAVKTSGKIVSDSRPKAISSKIKQPTAKLKTSEIAPIKKSKAEKPVSEVSAQTLDALKKNSATRKITAKIESASAAKSPKAPAKTTAEPIKIAAKRTVSNAAPRTSRKIAETIKKPASPNVKSKIQTVETKPTAAKSKAVKTSEKTVVATQKPARRQIKAAETTTAKIEKKIVRSAAKSNAAPQAETVKKTKLQAPVKVAARKKVLTETKEAPRKTQKIAPSVAAKKVESKTEKVPVKPAVKNLPVKTEKAQTMRAPKKTGQKSLQSKAIPKVEPIVSAATAKNRRSVSEKTDAVEKTEIVETLTEAPLPAKPKNKKAKPIGAAVFRGKKERYDFKVFALNENFEPIPAVYIISKRKTDRHKRGHHALICIGETASIADELKRHRKGKCVKKHQANVVSILPEADEKARLRIESDLKAAHTVVCHLD